MTPLLGRIRGDPKDITGCRGAALRLHIRDATISVFANKKLRFGRCSSTLLDPLDLTRELLHDPVLR